VEGHGFSRAIKTRTGTALAAEGQMGPQVLLRALAGVARPSCPHPSRAFCEKGGAKSAQRNKQSRILCVAAKRRKNAAHSVSCGSQVRDEPSPGGAKDTTLVP
jgi:hypothetical protein